MKNEMALKIAEQHIQKMNPAQWDGNGEQPDSFDTRIATYAVDDLTELDISFEKEPDGWAYYCELRDSSSGDLLTPVHGKGGDINSPQSLAEIIMEACVQDGNVR